MTSRPRRSSPGGRLPDPATRTPGVPVPQRREGLWYYAVLLLSFGILAPLPFAHAAARLGSRLGWLWPVLYAGAVVGLLVASNRSPVGPADSNADSNLVGATLVGLVVVAAVHLTYLRHRVWPPAVPADPVRAALAARKRRERARRIARRDPLLARDLGIGRPDLAGDYDDGGLVDVNSAPAEVIARICGIELGVAAQIVRAREVAGIPFGRVDDLFTSTDVSVALWDRIRDRAVALSA